MKLTMEEQVSIYGQFLTKETLTVNSLVQNRSLFYIARIFKLYDMNLYNYLAKLQPVAIGIADILHTGQRKHLVDAIYILINSKTDFTVVKDYSFYHNNYIFDEIETSKLRMLVFVLPDVNKYLQKFRTSQYSKMFTKNELSLMFTTYDELNSFQYKVLSGDKQHRKEYLKYVNATFNTTLKLSDVTESDFPISLQSEIFNYKS